MPSEIVSVEVRSLGNEASLALFQSTYSVLSFFGDSQKAALSANSGRGFDVLLMEMAFSNWTPSYLANRNNKELSIAISHLSRKDNDPAKVGHPDFENRAPRFRK